MIIRETTCKTALTKSKIPGFDYALNPYVGCQHACAYCYARFMGKYRPCQESWGHFVDAKTNIVEVLEKQIKKIKPGTVTISSVTDPYQTVEKNYKLTRGCLEILAEHKFEIAVLTKSSLITRDIDILKKFPYTQNYTKPGLTINYLDDKHRKNFEPYASPIPERLASLQKLSEAGLDTLVFLGPFMPGVSDQNLEKLFTNLKKVGVDYMLVDKLNIKSGNFPEIKRVLDKHYPELAHNFTAEFLKSDYYDKLKVHIQNLAKHYGIPCEVIY